MRRTFPKMLVFWVAFLALAAVAPAQDYFVYLDLDDDPGTGCDVMVAGETFQGAEQQLVTTVGGGSVTAVARQECGGATFDPPIAVDMPFTPPWPVGAGLGTSGGDVIETYFPLSAASNPTAVRLGFASTGLSSIEDALLSDVTVVLNPLAIPSLSEWGLIVLSLLLTLAAWGVLRRHAPGAAGLVVILIASSLAVGTVWAAIMLDGDPSDWVAGDLAGTDPLDAVGSGSDIVATFARLEDDNLFFRFDVEGTVPPTAVDDTATVTEDDPATAIDVLMNDLNPSMGMILVTGVTQPPGGTVTITGGGTGVNYTPDPDFCNDGVPTDDFTYTLNGGSMATVAVTVTCVDDLPTANGDTATVTEDDPATAIDVLMNDTDPEMDPITITMVTQPPGGTVAITGGGTGLTYEPDPDFCNDPPGTSTDDFTYTINGGDTATVMVTVTCVGDPPVANDDTATVSEDDPATAIDVLMNDTDADMDPITITMVTQPTDGTVVITGGGTSLTYQPDPDFCNDGVPTDDFTYTINGGDTATVAVTVTCVDDPATANDDMATVTEDDPATAIDVLLNDTDPEMDPILITGASDPAGGTVVITGGGTGLTYEPDPDFCNDGTPTDDFTYTITGGDTATVAVTVTCVNDPPMVTNAVINYATAGNTQLHVAGASIAGVVSIADAVGALTKAGPINDVDGPSAPSFVVQNTNTGNGDLILAADGTFTYVPNPGFTGVDMIAAQVTDGAANVPVTIQVTVSERVWYVHNVVDANNPDPAGADAGRSNDAFQNLAEAQAASGAGDTIFVFEGSTTSGTPITDGIALQANQRLHCHRIGLTVTGFGQIVAPSLLHPRIHSASGDAVVANAPGTEIRGCDLRGGDDSNAGTTDNGIEIDAAAATPVVIRDNILRGIASGHGLDARTAGGNLELDLRDNLFVAEHATIAGMNLDGTGAGTLFVTNFANNAMPGAMDATNPSVGSGLLMDTVTFDADPSDADFTGDVVAAGTLDLGAAGDRVGILGARLLNVSGNLDFTQLDVRNGAGVGFELTGTGTFNAAAGTGFRLAVGGGTIDTIGGLALDLDPATMAATFTSVSASGAGAGVSLVNLDGTLTIQGGTITSNDATTAFNVNGGAATLNHTGTITNSAGRSVLIQGLQGGGVSFGSGGSINDTGVGLLVQNNNAGAPLVDFNNPVTANTGTNTAITLTGNTGATVNFDGNLDVDTTTGTGFSASNNGAVNVTGTTATIDTTNGVAVDASMTAMGATFSRVFGTNGSGMGVNLSSNTGTTTFTQLQLNTTGGTGLRAATAGTVNVMNSMAAPSTITTTGAAAVDVNPTNVGMTFASVTSTNSTGFGVSLVGVTGNFVANGGSISGALGTAFRVGSGPAGSGANGNVTYAGTITNGAGRAVEVQDRTGGTVTFSGAITDNGASNSGLLIDDNNAGNPQILFTGTVDVTNTSGSAVTVTDSTTSTVSFADLDVDNSTSNQVGLFASNNGTGTLNITTGTVHGGNNTAVDIDNTVLGVNLARTDSIGGAAVGLDIRDTTGTFIIAGNGASAGPGPLDDNNGSGGSIHTKTGDAIFLSNATNVSLNYMNVGLPGMVLSNVGGNGIRADGVNGFTLTRSNLHNIANQNSPDEAALFATEPEGTWMVINSLFDRSFDDHIRIENSTVTSGFGFTLLDSTLRDNDASGNGNDGLLYVADGGGTDATFTVRRNVFDDSDGDHVQITLNGNASANVTIGGPMAADANNLGATLGTVLGSGITLSSGQDSGGNDFSGLLTYLIQNNDIQNAGAESINVNLSATSTAGTRYQGTIANNTIGTVGTTTSGGFGIGVTQNGDGTLNATINNNTIREYDGDHGILLEARDGSGRLNATVTMNTITNPTDTAVFDGLGINAGATGTDTSTICADIQGNNLVGSAGAAGGGADFAIFSVNSAAMGTTIILPGYAGAAKDNGAIVAFVQGNNDANPLNPAIQAPAPSGFTFFTGNSNGVSGAGASCP